MVLQVLLVLVILMLIVGAMLVSSVYVVRQQSVAIIERFGKYQKLSNSGIHLRAPFGIDKIAARVQLRLLQSEIVVETKTQDNVFVTMNVATQYRVNELNVTDAYYKLMRPEAQIKSYSNYDNPMRIQGIKGAIAYNALRDKGTEAIDLTIRNPVDIVKVNITENSIISLKDTEPDLYEKIHNFLKENETDYKGEITSISIPIDAEVPKWILKFVDYNDIINDNLKNFPLESIGITKFDKDTVNYTNVIRF